MTKLVAVPLASRVHEEQFYYKMLELFGNWFKREGVEVVDVVDNVDRAVEVASNIRGSIPIIVFLTGGTSRFGRIIMKSLEASRGIGIAHGLHNSLASAISAREKLKLKGIRLPILHCTKPGMCEEVVSKAVRVARAVLSVKGLRVGLIGFPEKNREASLFEEKFNPIIVPIPHDYVVARTERIRDVDDEMESLEEYVVTDGADLKVLSRILGLTKALRRIVEERKLNAIAIDCFPFILRYGYTPCITVALLSQSGITAACEADLRSLALMTISRELTGEPGWIANICSGSNRRIVVAHCTIVPSMTVEGRLFEHFETGKPYAIAAKLPRGTYTLTAISHNLKKLAAVKVRLVESGHLYNHMCRTQAVLALEFDVEKLFRKAISNHHVLIPGDVVEELKCVSDLLDLEFEDYKQ